MSYVEGKFLEQNAEFIPLRPTMFNNSLFCFTYAYLRMALA